jgi:hypothetical protein
LPGRAPVGRAAAHDGAPLTHTVDAERIRVGALVGGGVDDRLGIEEHEVRVGARLDAAASGDAESGRASDVMRRIASPSSSVLRPRTKRPKTRGNSRTCVDAARRGPWARSRERDDASLPIEHERRR